jgi:ABC-type uncharacterized transport system involved in gliding motility auxiliary subunit
MGVNSRGKELSKKQKTLRAIGSFMGVSGLVVFLSSSTLGLYSFGYKSWLTLGPVSFGLICIAVWFVLSYDKLTERLSHRAAQYIGLTAGYTVALTLMVVAGNYLIGEKDWRWDMTEAGVYSLSEQTETLLSSLGTNVRVTGFFEKSNPVFGVYEGYAQRYQKESDKISFRTFHPSYHVEEVRRYKITGESPPIIVETFWEDPVKKREYRFGISLKDLHHEELITNAIIQVAQKKRLKVYVIGGHGELDPMDSGAKGLQETMTDLRNEGYQPVPLSLVSVHQIPDDTDVLLIPGPTQSLLKPEVSAIRAYLAGGGRLCLMVEPEADHGLDSLLGEFGIQTNQDIIIDISPYGGVYGDRTAVAVEYSAHPIVSQFKNTISIFPKARTLSLNPGTGANATWLLKSGEQTWGETDFEGLAQGNAEWDAGEARGPVTLGVAASKPIQNTNPAEDDKRASESRILVFGDSDFISNQYRKIGANRNLFLNGIAWLSENSERIAIRPKSRGGNGLVLSPKQREGIAFFILYLLPVSLLCLGLGIWLVRRQR